MSESSDLARARRRGWMPLLLLAWLCLAPALRAELRVLFIGNSFTFGYGSTTDVPDLFDRLARAGGQDDPVTLMRTISGKDFEWHAGDSGTLAAINERQWTHVILQNYSTEPTHLTSIGGKSIADHLTFGRALYQQVMANHSHSNVVLFETWSRAASHALITGISTDSSFACTAQFQNELRTNYQLLRDNLNKEFPDAPPVSVAPVGSTWEQAGALLPLSDPGFVDLFMPNESPQYGYHANDCGTYLAACVFYAKLYGSSPVGLHMDPLIGSLNLNFGSDPGMPAYLEAKAWEMTQPPGPEFKATTTLTPFGDIRLSWPSRDGMLYNVRASDNPAGAPSTWAVIESAIPPSGIGNNSTSFSLSGPRRFFVIEEYAAP